MASRSWRRRAGVLALGAALALVTSGCLGATVSKSVVNGAPGGTYIIGYDCVVDLALSNSVRSFTPGGSGSGLGPPAKGQFTAFAGQEIFFVAPFFATSCTFTETNAGAAQVTFACLPGDSGITGCTAAPNSLVITKSASTFGSVKILVTNTYPGPAATTTTTFSGPPPCPPSCP